jgi:phage tail-like protein
MGLVSLLDVGVLTTAMDPVLTHNFAVQIDAIPMVHMWSSVDGLKMQLQSAGSRGSAGKGGAGQHTHGAHAQGALTNAGTLTLTRPLGPASLDIYQWVSKANTVASGPTKTTGIVVLVDRTASMIYSWEIFDVTPTGWSVAKLDAAKPDIVTETLTLSFSRITFDISLFQ